MKRTKTTDSTSNTRGRSFCVKGVAVGVVLALVLGLMGGCGAGAQSQKAGKAQVDLVVFAASSLTESLNKIAAMYEKDNPNVKVTYDFDSSGTLKTQIQEGAPCDVFVSAGQLQMDQLDASAPASVNTDRLDFVDSSTRLNLLENRVVLVTPKGNPKNIKSFQDMASGLAKGHILMAMGNSDVPVGQYTQLILKYFKLNEASLAAKGCISYGTNVKEVATQVSEASVDCGIIYYTDAYSAGLHIVDYATPEMCGHVVYPAAALKGSASPIAAKAFLKYLSSGKAMSVFEKEGFKKA